MDCFFHHALLEETPDGGRILKPQQLDFMSYPYEWCFGQLQAAATRDPGDSATRSLRRDDTERRQRVQRPHSARAAHTDRPALAGDLERGRALGGVSPVLRALSRAARPHGEPWPGRRTALENAHRRDSAPAGVEVFCRGKPGSRPDSRRTSTRTPPSRRGAGNVPAGARRAKDLQKRASRDRRPPRCDRARPEAAEAQDCLVALLRRDELRARGDGRESGARRASFSPPRRPHRRRSGTSGRTTPASRGWRASAARSRSRSTSTRRPSSGRGAR